ncbi:MAG: hypothetical protein CMN56_13845 [Sneathiella sp.]|nr:hypothetical protein [Sneathiella sp.]
MYLLIYRIFLKKELKEISDRLPVSLNLLVVLALLNHGKKYREILTREILQELYKQDGNMYMMPVLL